MNWNEAAANVPDQAEGSSGYMKLKAGPNRFRILSEPIQGWLWWTNDNKPHRARNYPEAIPADIRKGEAPKFFWTFVVWNLKEARVQILELTQQTIIGPIRDLINAEEWGDPRQYSLTVNRTGEGLETTYSVVPSPVKIAPKEVLDAYEAAAINLEALFDGGNPFGSKDGVVGEDDL